MLQGNFKKNSNVGDAASGLRTVVRFLSLLDCPEYECDKLPPKRFSIQYEITRRDNK
jgi:hypothetical protein